MACKHGTKRDSPPRERVAVETRIVRDSDETIRTAIESELLRGGQVYFLHNRVADIGKVEKRLREMFGRGIVVDESCSGRKEGRKSSLPLQLKTTTRPPRIVVAHGQMDSRR